MPCHYVEVSGSWRGNGSYYSSKGVRSMKISSIGIWESAVKEVGLRRRSLLSRHYGPTGLAGSALILFILHPQPIRSDSG